jgi:magnesium-transporting ATPase (P-type)
LPQIRLTDSQGDHPVTARAIGALTHIITLPSVALNDNSYRGSDDDVSVIAKGADLAALSDIQWTQLLAKKEIVFARYILSI